MIDHFSRPPKRPQHRKELLSVALVVALVLGVWLLSGGNPGTPTSRAINVDVPTATQSADPSPAGSSAELDNQADQSDPGIDPESGLPVVTVDQLPPQAREVLSLIERGGPFRYDRDGSRFGNYEGLLPDEQLGYYSEYTVDTPGIDSRGARRIVAGEQGERYYTRDHYNSFARIADPGGLSG